MESTGHRVEHQTERHELTLQRNDVPVPGTSKLIQRKRQGVPAVGFGLLEIAGRQHRAYGLAELVLPAYDVQQKRRPNGVTGVLQDDWNGP